MSDDNLSNPEIISRRAAVALGLSHYFTGKPCKNGHVSRRSVKWKDCLACSRDWQRRHTGYVDVPVGSTHCEAIDGETWRPVVGFDGSYEVSDLGRVRSLSRNVRNRRGVRLVRGKVMSPRLCMGYPKVHLSRGGRYFYRTVHSLVLEAFVGPRPPGTECCHKNGIRTDARLENLRWDSHVENMSTDMLKHGRIVLSAADAKAIRERCSSGERQCDVAAEFGVSRSHISHIVRRSYWNHA